MAKRKRPRPRRAPDDSWNKISNPSDLEDFEAVIDRTTEKLVFVVESGAVLRGNDVVLVLSPLQQAVLRALAGNLLTKERLAAELQCDENAFYVLFGILVTAPVCAVSQNFQAL